MGTKVYFQLVYKHHEHTVRPEAERFQTEEQAIELARFKGAHWIERVEVKTKSIWEFQRAGVA